MGACARPPRRWLITRPRAPPSFMRRRDDISLDEVERIHVFGARCNSSRWWAQALYADVENQSMENKKPGVVQIKVPLETPNPFASAAPSVFGVTRQRYFLNHVAIIVSPSVACSSHHLVTGNENSTLFWSSVCSVEKRSSSAALALCICR